MAAMAFLTDRHIVIAKLPSKYAGAPDAQLIAWAKANDVAYYVHRPPISPWRLWHFRAPWLQRWMTGQQEIPHNPYWVLYRMYDDRAEEVDVPEVSGWPTHVPPCVDVP